MDLIWFAWSLLLLIIWGLVYAALKSPESRHEMLVVSAWTSLLAVTEPLFVPAYWNPPSLFGLAQATGFDIESFIFSFAIGGLAVVLYELFIPVRHVPFREKHAHLYHPLALVFTPSLFVAITLLTHINPIYSAIIALLSGGCLVLIVRSDLRRKMLASAIILPGPVFCLFPHPRHLCPGIRGAGMGLEGTFRPRDPGNPPGRARVCIQFRLLLVGCVRICVVQAPEEGR